MNAEMQVRQLIPGTKVLLTNGEKAIFKKANRTRFIGVINGKEYDISFALFKSVDTLTGQTPVVEPDPKRDEYMNLKPGELFYTVENKRVILYSFEKFAETRIHGKNPITGGGYAIPAELYGGRVIDLMTEKVDKKAPNSAMGQSSYENVPFDMHKKFVSLASQLSPENLTCDGELSKTEVQRRLKSLQKQWRDLEQKLGFSVDETSVWKREMTERQK